MEIHFQHIFIQDLHFQLYATRNDIRNNWRARHIAMHEK